MEKTIITDRIKNVKIKVKKNETLNYIVIPERGCNSGKKMIFDLEGENSKLNFTTIIIGKNNEKFPFETISNHKGSNTKANFQIKTVLYDNSELDYKGKLKINKNAKSTEAHLSHHSLLLSNKAKIKTLPSLEIDNNNVKTSHKATIGKIDKDMLFYLQTRGLNKKISEELLIKGFLFHNLPKIAGKKLQKLFTKKCSTQKS
jgi:Fe-S cluster assembly scaffold protein SufB